MKRSEIKKNLINDDMRINKSNLMKYAWTLADLEYCNKCLQEGFRGSRLEKTAEKTLYNDTLKTKKSWLALPHIRKDMKVDFSKKDFLSAGMKKAWHDAKEQVAAETEKRQAKIESELREKEKIERLENTVRINKNAPRRELVIADKYVEGDKLGNFVITGLGRIFRTSGETSSLHHIGPETEYVQYAYFN